MFFEQLLRKDDFPIWVCVNTNVVMLLALQMMHPTTKWEIL